MKKTFRDVKLSKEKGLDRLRELWRKGGSGEEIVGAVFNACKRKNLLENVPRQERLSDEEKRELFLMMIEMADGNKIRNNYDDEDECFISNLHQSVGEDVYHHLCLNYFRDYYFKGHDPLHTNMYEIIYDKEVFDRVLWFLRSKEYKEGTRLINIQTKEDVEEISRDDQIAQKFALGFCKLIIGEEFYGEFSRGAKVAVKMDDFKEEYIKRALEILYDLDELEILFCNSAESNINMITDKLYELIMNRSSMEKSLPDYSCVKEGDKNFKEIRRKPTSLEEAVWKNLKGARVCYILLCIRNHEEKHHDLWRLAFKRD